MAKTKDGGSSLLTLDLHGQRMDGLESRVDRFIVDAQKKGHARVRIMTGKGTGQVQSAVKAYLKLGGFPFQAEKLPKGTVNEGVLIVHI